MVVLSFKKLSHNRYKNFCDEKGANKMKLLIHDEQIDTPEFLFETIANRGYKVGLAKEGSEIMAMLSNDQYDVVLTNGKYKELSSEDHTRLKSSSVFIIDITDSSKENQDMALKADSYLLRPLLISELWLALGKPFQELSQRRIS
jgi:DNA-binding response OmpR family regulator